MHGKLTKKKRRPFARKPFKPKDSTEQPSPLPPPRRGALATVLALLGC